MRPIVAALPFPQDQLPLDFQLHPTKCTHVLQVVEAEDWLRWCVVPSSWQYRQSCEEPKALPQAVAHVGSHRTMGQGSANEQVTDAGSDACGCKTRMEESGTGIVTSTCKRQGGSEE